MSAPPPTSRLEPWPTMHGRPLWLGMMAIAAIAVLVGQVHHADTLPSCDAPSVHARLADLLEEIPALAGRDAQLIELAQPRSRGYAGRTLLRACQGRLITSIGAGAIEYSIRRGRDGTLAVRPELFQGGWRDEMDSTDG